MAAFPSIGFTSMTMRLRSSTAISTSPFTFDQQVYEHQGVRWEAEVTLPPLTRSEAKEVEGFFASLRGQSETFTMGNPLHNETSLSGTITGSDGSTSVTGTVSGGVAVGDYFSINNTLHIFTQVSGGLKIMPPLRNTVTNATCTFALPKGTWRLASNEIDWNINRAGLYGFTFACVEAI